MGLAKGGAEVTGSDTDTLLVVTLKSFVVTLKSPVVNLQPLVDDVADIS